MGDRLLLVESDSTLCGQLARFLTTLGYQVDAADSVGAALAALSKAPPALTLLDAQLDEDPATIAFATRQCKASLIIMGRPEVADALVIDIGVEVSPDRVLHKPFSAQGLSDIIQAALRARADEAEAVRRRLQERSELDEQLGALQAALGELTGMKASPPPPPEPLASATPAPQTPVVEPIAETPVAVAPVADAPVAQVPVAATPVAPSPVIAQQRAEPTDAAQPPVPVSASHDLLVAEDGVLPRSKRSAGPASRPLSPSASAQASVPPRSSMPPRASMPPGSSVPPGPILFKTSGAMGPLLDASVLPDLPLESMELIAQFALRPMTAESPLDPRGIYGPVTMPELIYNCFRDLFSGWLLLRRDAVTKTVLMRGGRPVFAQSNIKAETLGTMLVSTGRLSPEDSERSLRYADALGIRQGEAIVRLGMLSEDALRDGLRDQLMNRLVSCFSWGQAEYGLTYDPDASEGVEAADVNPLVVIFEGVKTRYPLAPLLAHYDLLVRQAPRTTSRLADYATMLRAYEDELAIAEACDGSRSLGEVLAVSPLGLIGTLRVMRALESMNCLTYGSVIKPKTRPSGSRSSDAHRSIRRSGSDSGSARSARSGDGGRVSGGYRTLRTDDRTATGSPKRLRPTGAHASGIRRAGTRRSEGTSEVAAPTSRGPESRPANSRGPGSRGPQSRGSRDPVGRRPTHSSAPQPASVRKDDSSANETPQALLARLEGADTSYALLGVSSSANRASISKAASGLMRTLTQLTMAGDPEVERGARAFFAKVKTAGEALTNPQRRRAYDALNLPIPPATGTDLVAAESDFKLGRICLANQAMDRARSYFERAAVQDPHQAIYQVYLAWATFTLADDSDRRTRMQAIELAREALKSDASRDDGYVLLGRMYQTANSHDQAVRAFSKALEINSGNTQARLGLEQLESDQDVAKKDTGLFGNLFSRR